MTNPENSAKLAQFFPPPRKSLLNVETLAKTNPLLKPGQIESVVVKASRTAR
jgi:multiple sugar transport system substrate-binding protein